MKKKAKKTAARPAKAARPASGTRVVSYEAALSACKSAVEDLANLADLRQAWTLYIAALDNAIRFSSVTAIGRGTLENLRSSAEFELKDTQMQINEILDNITL